MNGPQETAWSLRNRKTGDIRHEEVSSKDSHWGHPKKVSSRCSLVAGAPMPDHIYATSNQQEGKEVAVKEDKLALLSSLTAIFPTCIRHKIEIG